MVCPWWCNCEGKWKSWTALAVLCLASILLSGLFLPEWAGSEDRTNSAALELTLGPWNSWQTLLPLAERWSQTPGDVIVWGVNSMLSLLVALYNHLSPAESCEAVICHDTNDQWLCPKGVSAGDIWCCSMLVCLCFPSQEGGPAEALQGIDSILQVNKTWRTTKVF